MMQLLQSHAAPTRAVGICFAFCAVSSFCVLQNKYILSRVLPNAPALLFFQSSVSVIVLTLMHCAGIIRLSNVQWNRLTPCACSLSYTANVMAGLWSLRLVSVPAFSTLKRSNMMVTWFVEDIYSRNEGTRQVLPSVLLMAFGVVLAGLHDLEFSALGYILGILSAVTQSISFETGKRAASPTGDLWSVVFQNSTVSMIVQGLYLTASRQLNVLGALQNASFVGYFNLATNATTLLVLNYLIFLNCTVNSPLAHVVTGNVKALLTTIVSFAIFGLTFSQFGLLGLLLNMVGAFYFSLMKMKTTAQRHAKKADDAARYV